MKKFWKDRLYNKNVLKRTLYIYLPFFIIAFLLLNLAAKFTENADTNSLSGFHIFKGRIPVVYNEKYNIHFWGFEEFHPFDTKKYQHIIEELNQELGASTDGFITALKPSQNILSLAHTQEYLNSLKSSWVLARITELGFLRFFPNKLSQNLILEPMLYQSGGSLIASMAALEHGWAINLGGGFHHASSDNGEGFCALADISMIIKFLRKEGKISKAMIIDLDAHQGNGHGQDFLEDSETYIMDFYNHEIYPNDVEAEKGIDLKVKLASFSGDKLYLDQLEKALPQAFKAFNPDIIIYVAGTDLLEGDPLGGLSLSEEAVIQRDEMVFQYAFDQKTPIVMLLSGGYQKTNAHVIAQSILNLRKKFNLF